MRSILLLLAITLAGCGDDNGTNPAADMSVVADLAHKLCSTTCPTCAAGTTCVTGVNEFNAACLKSCTDQRDCPSGMQCASLKAFSDTTRWCVDPTTPSKNCGFGCALGPPQRCDGDVAVHGLVFAEYCATAYEYCPHGCTLGDGGADPRCNP
jgi:hypothetical protein